MSLLLSFVLAATPASCGEVFPNAWNAWLERERIAEAKPRFEKVPDARERVEKAWLTTCAALDEKAIDCLRGLTLQQRIAEQYDRDKRMGLPKAESDHAIHKLKKRWTVLECSGVDAALTKAVDTVVPPPARPTSPVDEAPRPKPAKRPKGEVID